ncbi:lipopolysaccharide biosynthesis protein [Clostridium beijerinckii]|uniref:O-antigen/teichoic acid export membrane protein n=1 Tax=Clostridium beijerinckii TaxID=1520 RepID=A0AAE5EXZ8_CLOBE|nr:oligosaccharide flippase family protein [Clostridium beijerinckii]NSB16554.1 O-antigen/teichoic acid export membrane protein [Clostridium beijerinckii]OOM23616.1 polysaccharide biosynthesis protein [Clostridium beijerinckii]
MRTRNSIKNSLIGILGQLFNIGINFISRTLFIQILGANYLGINGLFTNVLSMLSLAELGIGSAITYHMYKPLANDDREKIKSLMYLYAKSYKIIGLIVGIIGISILPFLDLIINDAPNVDNLSIIYVLFLLNSVISYFFAYKTSITIADQKNYIVTIKQQKYLFFQTIVQIGFLALAKNYIFYLIIQITFTFLLNLSISKRADVLYPFLKEKNIEHLTNDEKGMLFKHVAAMMSHRVGGVVVSGTDNILISSFVGVYWVGIYSNYTMIIGMLNKFIEQIFTAITASVGNLNVKESSEKSYDIYKKIFFINFWIYGFCSICLFILINPFIKLWIGSEYMMSIKIIVIILLNFYITGMRKTTITYNTTLGLFWNDRYKPWIEAIINLVASITLISKLGIVGVFLGTFTSTVTTSLWVEPYILFKHGFNKKLRNYFSKYILYAFVTIIAAFITNEATSLCRYSNIYLDFVIKLLICITIPNIVFLLFFIKSYEFGYIKELILEFIRKK